LRNSDVAMRVRANKLDFVAQGGLTSFVSGPGNLASDSRFMRWAAHNMLSSRARIWRGICLFVFVAVLLASPAFAAGKPVSWKPITQALLRVNDQPVKNWNVYQANKKGDPLLLEMGNRFLLIQVHERKIFELAPAKIEHKGAELLWDPATLPAEPLASADWLIKDVGFAYRIGARLVAENRVLDLQLPHPMDLRYL
jgi:hypothetical protein